MAKPSIKLYFDILSPLTYLAFYIIHVSPRRHSLIFPSDVEDDVALASWKVAMVLCPMPLMDS